MLAREVRLEYGGRSAISVNQFILCNVQLGRNRLLKLSCLIRRECCGGVVESLVNELGDRYVDNWLSPLLDVFFLVIPAKTSEALILPLFFVFCPCYPTAGLFFF